MLLETKANLWVTTWCNVRNSVFPSISPTEISHLEKLFSPVKMSVGTNMFINGKLDNSVLSFVCVCATLKFKAKSECKNCDSRIALLFEYLIYINLLVVSLF